MRAKDERVNTGDPSPCAGQGQCKPVAREGPSRAGRKSERSCCRSSSYIGSKPSKKAVAKLCEQIGQMTQRTLGRKETEVLVADLNQKLQGWASYFQLGSVHNACRIVDGHVRYRLRRWLCHKNKVQGQGKSRFRDEYLNTELGLIRLERLKSNRL
jgi:RNA-directed DNA polymerase